MFVRGPKSATRCRDNLPAVLTGRWFHDHPIHPKLEGQLRPGEVGTITKDNNRDYEVRGPRGDATAKFAHRQLASARTAHAGAVARRDLWFNVAPVVRLGPLAVLACDVSMVLLVAPFLSLIHI